MDHKGKDLEVMHASSAYDATCAQARMIRAGYASREAREQEVEKIGYAERTSFRNARKRKYISNALRRYTFYRDLRTVVIQECRFS